MVRAGMGGGPRGWAPGPRLGAPDPGLLSCPPVPRLCLRTGPTSESSLWLSRSAVALYPGAAAEGEDTGRPSPGRGLREFVIKDPGEVAPALGGP